MAVLIVQGDARRLSLADQSVQTVITSPPYWGLRDYGQRGSLGLEPTPATYVSALVAVFTEVWRVLRDDGTVWLNLGDSYVANSSNQVSQTKHHIGSGFAGANRNGQTGLKPKDLVGIPWRVAFALQAAGWYLRSDIIWAKPNPMPESVQDRPTRSHEYLFLLTKQAKYYYDAAAIAEPVSGAMLREVEQGYSGTGLKDYASAGVQNPSSVKARIIANARLKGNARSFRGGGAYTRGQSYSNDTLVDREMHGNTPNLFLTRNKRTVWTITPKPFRGAHFATFPPQLVEPCLLAGSRLGDVVLDPFSGSGTVGVVATQHGRHAVLLDLSMPYCQIARQRNGLSGLVASKTILASDLPSGI
jgi:DNA modification methylase